MFKMDYWSLFIIFAFMEMLFHQWPERILSVLFNAFGLCRPVTFIRRCVIIDRTSKERLRDHIHRLPTYTEKSSDLSVLDFFKDVFVILFSDSFCYPAGALNVAEKNVAYEFTLSFDK